MLKLELLAGELLGGDILSSGSGATVRISGGAFSPAEAWNEGLRLVTVTRLSGDELVAGEVLVGEQERPTRAVRGS
ncbi:hypothetical protein [Sorangium sp. So ce388]|uniref:hypothetical protein n=1 Tax=Sorangium sp. So ce388 TaxID=3133309 RepID=UPI003F5CBA77